MNLRGEIIARGRNSGKIEDETIEIKNFDDPPKQGINHLNEQE